MWSAPGLQLYPGGHQHTPFFSQYSARRIVLAILAAACQDP